MPRRAAARRAAVLVAAAACVIATAAPAQRAQQAPGYRALAFEPPVPGTYALPPLGTAADGDVLDDVGRSLRLSALLGDKLVVLSFIYTSCSETAGCPLATFVLGGVQDRLLDDTELRGRVRLVSLSFDPARDRPDVLHRYAARVVRDGFDWRFLTTASEDALAPLLEGFGQSVTRDTDAQGRPLGTISHVLRVFLLDRERRIRNVYSTSFLHADTLVADLRTLAREEAESSAGVKAPAAPVRGARATAASSAPAGGSDGIDELLRRATAPALGLPAPPAGEPLTREKVALGRKLFFDRRLSRNETFSCAMCHVPAQGFTNNEMATAVGIEGHTVKRNAPTLLNVAYAPVLFHDARESDLASQPWAPLLAPDEMGNPSADSVLERLHVLRDYDGLFEAAFDGRGPSRATVGAALASYQRTLRAADAPFDRWRYGGDEGATTDAAKRGFALFTGKGGCASCHTVGEDAALFSDFGLHATGLGYRAMRARQRDVHAVDAAPPDASECGRLRRIEIAPGVHVDFELDAVAEAAETPPEDLGRFEVTGDGADRWKYKTPTLRNVALTAPYMHDGSLATLRDVVAYYDAGGEPGAPVDARVRPLHLSESERHDLVAFLDSLTSPDVAALVAASEAAPIGER